jgi:hypothetical protein
MERLIDIKQRGSSYCFNTNILYRKDNIYLMDNHRMAAWCWANHIDENKKYTIVHIDKHYDTLGSLLKEWTTPIKNGLKSLSFNEYDSIEFQKNKFEKYKIFRWDNYIPIFHYFYSNQINKYVFYTHNQGSIPENLKKHITHCPAHNLINDFYDCSSESEDNLIINLDIDYFFCSNPHYFIFFSDYAIAKLVESIMRLVIDNKNNILTIALSPECCGGWDNSIDFIRKYFNKYGINVD